jgi:hypothetical protein
MLTSCDLFSPEPSSVHSDLQVADSLIDFTKVDVYPVFADCENFSEDDNQRACFEKTLTQKLSTALRSNSFKVKKVVNCTTFIEILIDNKGKASLAQINLPEQIAVQLPALDSIIRQSIARLPHVKPAVKRGIFVRSQYKLAIIVRTI